LVLGGGTAAAQSPTQVTPPSGAPASPPPGPPVAPAAGSDRFFRNGDLNFNFLIALGSAAYGLADPGVLLAVAARITDGDPGSAFAAFNGAGEALAAAADEAAAAGRLASAGDLYRQASNLIDTSTYFLDGSGQGERFAPVWRRQQELWDAGTALLPQPPEKIRIPYQGTFLPGDYYHAPTAGAGGTDSRRRPLLIFNNGSDGAMPFAWSTGIAPALERGYDCLAFFGPGQGSVLVDQGLFFRPDWEAVVTPVVDYALTRRDVDPRRIALMGVSQGGYWVPRAAAFEPRLAAAVADPGVVDVAASWLSHSPPEMLALLHSGQKAAFDQYIAEGLQEDPKSAATLAFRMRPFGFTSFYDAYTAVQQYTLAGVVDRIRVPLLVTDPEGEEFWPGQSQRLYDALPGEKALVPFTAAEGADLHCEPKAPRLRAQRIFDWLDGVLAARA
jgi:hypothetical protein